MDLNINFSDIELRDGFAIRYHPCKGRHLVAARPFAPGAVILRQDPYVSVLYDERTPGFCDFCYLPSKRPLRCSRSKLARYCCKEHQRLAWSAGYKEECEALVRCAPRVPPPTVRLAARLLWRRTRCSTQQEQQGGAQPAAFHVHHQPPWDSDYEGLWRLEHHWDKLDDRRKQLYAQMAVVTWQYMYGNPDCPCPADDGIDGTTIAADTVLSVSAADNPAAHQAGEATRAVAWPGFRAVAQLLSLLACNCHTVCDEELRPLGIAIYPTGALVNHSCNPAATQTFIGHTLVLRALRPFAPGDEITIAYIELAATRQERRETLADSYFFDINATDEQQQQQQQQPPASTCAVTAYTAAPHTPSLSQVGGPTSSLQPMEVDDGTRSQAAAKVAVTASSAEPTEARDRAASRPSQVENPMGAALEASNGGGPNSGPLGAIRPPPLLTLDVAPNAQLHVYDAPLSGKPPWRTDPRDGDLTRVEMTVGSSGINGSMNKCSGSSNSLQKATLPVPGGLLVRLVSRRPNEPEEEVEEHLLDENEEEEQCQRQWKEAVGECEGYGAGTSGRAEYGGAENGACSSIGAVGPRRPPRLRLPGARANPDRAPGPPPPRIELLAWGPWLADLVRAAGEHRASGANAAACAPLLEQGEAVASQVQAAGTVDKLPLGLDGVMASSGEGPGPSAGGYARWTATTSPHAAVAALMRRCVTALRLSHQAEMASGSGEAAEAVSMLQMAIKLLDGAAITDSPQAQQQQQGQQRYGQPGVTKYAACSDNFLSLGTNHVLRLRISAQLLKAAIDSGSSGAGSNALDWADSAAASEPWSVALEAARALEPQYRLCYPHTAWSNLSLHYATLAKLEMLLGRPRSALRAVSQALEGLRLTHDSSCRSAAGEGAGGVVEQVMRTGREAEMEVQAQIHSGRRLEKDES